MKDVQSCGFGEAWKKPIEQRLNRLVDYWQISQPLHLRHLAIIRDTALVGKTPHYVHYTYEHFKSLVDRGVASWDAVAANSYGTKNKAKLTIPLPEDQAELDEYGFPRLPPHAFQGAEDGATLAECIHAFTPQPLPIDLHGNIVGGNPSKHERKVMENYWNVKTGSSSDRKPRRSINKEGFGTGSVKMLQKSAEHQTPKARRVPKPYEGKKRGRPRKVQTIGLPPDFDKLSEKEKNDVLRLQRSGIEYASGQVEKQAALRMAEGLDMIEARELVLAEVDAQYIRSEQRPISDAIRAHLGLSQAPQPLQHYLPSTAAHTLQNFSPREHVDKLGSIQGRSRGGRRPRTQKQVNSNILDASPVVPARATRGRPTKKLAVPGEVPYFPSIAAHTFPQWKLDPPKNSRKPQAKARRNSRNVTYLPSMAAHTFPYYEQDIAAILSKKRKRRLSSQVRLPNKRFRYRSRESFYAELSETAQGASDSSLYLSAKERDPGRRGQPRARLAIFVLDQLVQLPWFVQEKTSINYRDDGRDHIPSYLQETQSNLQQRETLEDHQSPSQAQPYIATVATTKAGVAHHGEALDSANTRTEMDLTISQESERDTPATAMGGAEHYERCVASEPRTSVTDPCTTGDLNADVVQLPQRSIDDSNPPHDAAPSNTRQESLPRLVVDAPNQQKLSRQKKTAGGSVAMLRKSIILDLLSRCGGVIPGDKALDAPFVVEWNKRGQSGQPDKETVRKTVEALCVAGKVRKLRFSFTNAKGVTITKSMVTTTDISATDPKVLETQRAIISYDPVCYYPEVLDTPVEWDRRAYSGWRRELDLDENTVSLQNKPAYVAKYEEGKRALDERRALKTGMIAMKRAAYEESQRQRQTQAKRLIDSLIDAAKALRQAGHLEQEARGADEIYANKHSKLIPGCNAALTALYLAQNDDQPTGPYTKNITVEEQLPTIRRCYIALRALAPAGFLDERGLPASVVGISGRGGRRSALSLSDQAVQSDILLGGLLKPPGKPRKVQRLASLRSPTFTKASRQTAAPVPGHWDTEAAVELRFRFSEGSLRPLAPSVWDAADREEHDWANEEVVATESALPSPTLEPPPWAILDLRTINAGSRGYHALQNSLETDIPSHADVSIQDHFIHDVDALERWELENIEESPSAFPGWPFVNHVMECAHTKTDFPWIDMHATSYKYLKNGENGNFVSKPVLGSSSNLVSLVREPSKTFRVSRQVCYILPKPSEGSYGMFVPNDAGAPWEYKNHISANYDGEMDMTSQKARSLKRKRELSHAGSKRRCLSRPVTTASLGPEAEDVQKITYRGPRKVRIFGKENEKRLLVAVVVVRVIAGGLDQRMDWNLVAKSFQPEYDEMFIHSLWPGIRQKYRLQIDKLTSDFQAIFPKAYAKRLVPPLDFDHLDEYPWAQLVEWTLENMDVAAHLSTLELPATRSDFDKLFSLKDSSDVSLAPFFDSTTENTVAKRQAIQSKQAFVCPIACGSSRSKEDKATELDIIKSYVRANVLTPDNDFKAEIALARLSTFDKRLMSCAVEQLLSDRILTGPKEHRLLPGRNYKLSKTCFDALKKNPTPETLQRAATFKRRLDRLLLHPHQEDGESSSSNRSAIFNSLNNNEQAVVILNLLANGRITLRPHNPPMNKFGFLTKQGNIKYETRKMDKKCLYFSVEVAATEKYVEGNPLLPLPAAPAPHLTFRASTQQPDDPNEIEEGQKERRIPFWYSIHDRLIPQLWALAHAAVLSQVVLRPGIREAEIVKRVSPALGAWEVRLVLEWMTQAGIGEKIGDGWNTREWWWAGLDIGDDGAGPESGNEVADKEMEDVGVVGVGRAEKGIEEDDVGTSTDDARVEELIMQGA